MRCTCIHTGESPFIRDSRGRRVEVRSGRKDSEGWRIKWRTEPTRYRKNSPYVTRQKRAADAMYENVVRGRAERTKRTSAGSDDVRRGEGSCLFYRVEAKTYDIVPGKVAGFYFRDPVPLPPARAFLSPPFFSYTPSPSVFREWHKFPPEKYGAMTRELSFAYFFLPPPFLAKSSTRGLSLEMRL